MKSLYLTSHASTRFLFWLRDQATRAGDMASNMYCGRRKAFGRREITQSQDCDKKVLLGRPITIETFKYYSRPKTAPLDRQAQQFNPTLTNLIRPGPLLGCLNITRQGESPHLDSTAARLRACFTTVLFFGVNITGLGATFQEIKSSGRNS